MQEEKEISSDHAEPDQNSSDAAHPATLKTTNNYKNAREIELEESANMEALLERNSELLRKLS